MPPDVDTTELADKPPLLLLTYVYPPDNYSGAARPARFVKYLRRLGHDVTVIAATPGRGGQVEQGVFRVRGEFDHAPRRSFPALLEKAARLTVLPYDEGFTWVPRVLALASRRKGATPPPVIFSTSPPLTTHVAAVLLKKRFGWRWIADFRDPLMGNPFRTSEIARRLDAALERLIFRHADALVANTDAVRDMWAGARPRWRDKCHLIWNGFDAEAALLARPVPPRSYRVLAHAGTIYGSRHPGPLLAALGCLIADGSLDPASLKVRLVGAFDRSSVPVSGLFDLLLRQGCLECAGCLVPRSEAEAVTTTADYLLLLDVLEGPALQVPAKLFDYVSIGRPILACTMRGSPVERILGRAGIPHAVLHPDVPISENARRLKAFLQLPSSITPPSAWFQAEFSAESQAQTLSRIVQDLR
jgi:hypothetical protein